MPITSQFKRESHATQLQVLNKPHSLDLFRWRADLNWNDVICHGRLDKLFSLFSPEYMYINHQPHWLGTCPQGSNSIYTGG